MRSLLLCLLLLVVATPALSDSSMPAAEWADRQLPDPNKEAAARALMDEIRCLVCEGQAVGDSDAELAGDMRHLIRSRISAGESPEAIRNWLIERYGNAVSYRPPASPVTWPLWLAPLFLLGAGGMLLRRRFRWGRKE